MAATAAWGTSAVLEAAAALFLGAAVAAVAFVAAAVRAAAAAAVAPRSAGAGLHVALAHILHPMAQAVLLLFSRSRLRTRLKHHPSPAARSNARHVLL